MFLFNYAQAYELEGLDYKKILATNDYSNVRFSPLDIYSFSIRRYNNIEDIQKMIDLFHKIYQVNKLWNNNVIRQAQYYLVQAKMLKEINENSKATKYYAKFITVSEHMKILFEQKKIPIIPSIFFTDIESSISEMKTAKRNGELTLQQILDSDEITKDKEIYRDLTKEEIEYFNQYYEAKKAGKF